MAWGSGFSGCGSAPPVALAVAAAELLPADEGDTGVGVTGVEVTGEAVTGAVVTLVAER